MKTILNYCLILVFSSALFYSCGSSKSFNNKQYNNRYYIAMSKKEKTKEAKLEKPISALEKQKIDKPEQSLTTMVCENEIVQESEKYVSTETAATENTTNPETNSIKRNNKKIAETSLEKKENKSIFNEIPTFVVEKIKTQKEKFSPPASQGDALSLLWIVIIILLILWAIGGLSGGFGLGGLIHILLVIALILLILWLLRII